jgi:hypothetical protein
MRGFRSTATRATALAAVAAALGAGALAGCTAPGTAATATASSTSVASPTTTAVPAGEGAVGPDEQAVAAVLRTYQQAIAGSDYVLACQLMTLESAVQLTVAVQAAAAPAPVADCPQALAAVVGQPGAIDAAVEAANTVTVTDVTIEGLSATVRWSSTRQGVPRTDGVALQQVDGQWRVAGPA